MARRRADKADPKSATLRGGARRSKARTVASDTASESTLNERLAALERECATLRAELERERSRRKALEEVHAATRDRIAWALDSLQAILEARG
jgi:predicted  nucleic acid-binding Zn-ribbon protein